MKVSRVCKICGGSFKKYLSQLKENSTCSNPCRFEWLKSLAKRIPIEQRFWNFVEKTDGCWLWKGAVNKGGYGLFGYEWNSETRRGKQTSANRIAWILTYGPIGKEIKVCHSCDNPSCVRPDHLWIGTQKENIQDMIQKKREVRNPRRGEKHRSAKLTEHQVRTIRSSFQRGVSQSQLAREYSVVNQCINAIVHRKTWSHI